jgi:hypothetical protein
MAMSVKHASKSGGRIRREGAFLIQIVVLFALLVWGSSCGESRPGGRPGGPVGLLALPPGCPANSAPSDTSQLRACVDSLHFDTVAAVGDEQRLMVRGALPGPLCHGDSTHSCRYGPLAKIEPVKGAHQYGDSALQEGRIIARMFLRAGESEAYQKLGLVPTDTTYWWVRTGVDSSFFISRSGDGVLITKRSLEREEHPEGTFEQAVARWIWDDADEKANGPCGSACCKPAT